MESKQSVRRLLETVPLTADEQEIVKGDLKKLDGLIRKLENVPTLDGRTPGAIATQQVGAMARPDADTVDANRVSHQALCDADRKE